VPDLARPATELRAGFAPTDFSDRAGEALRPALDDALKLFREMGLRFVETELPDLAYGPLLQTILHGEAGAAFEDLIESGRVDELADARQIAELKACLDVSARDYLRAMRLRHALQDRWRSWSADFDILLAPTRLSVASLIGDPLDRPAASPATAPRRRGLSDHIAAANLAGWPALALPCGFAGGLPVSIAMIGRPFSENTLLALGMEFQRRSDWHRRKPPV
jgi:aspartyl-tRNA(Asn)/glutamyl-tRNA(Gln) amidotransferase subunit A